MKKTLFKYIPVILLVLLTTVACGSKAIYSAGTYTGTANGNGGPVTVEVVVSETEIVSVEVVDYSETAGVSDAAITDVPKSIVDTQGTDVDVVTGASLTSKAIIKATASALILASINSTPEEVSPTITGSYDVVIIGAGGAGLSAAVEALKAGSSVIVVEKMPIIGGNTIRAGSAMNAPVPERQRKYTMSESEIKRVEEAIALESKDPLMSKWQRTLAKEFDEYKASGVDYLFDSPSLHKIHTYDGGDYVGDPAIIDTFGDNAVDAFHFLKDLGTQWTDNVVAMIGTIWVRANKITNGEGTEFVNPQKAYIDANGGGFILESEVKELVMTDGRVTGVKGMTSSDSPFEYTASKAVVITTGGFGANVEMREHYNTHWQTLAASVETTNQPGATGDGIVMAEAIGAQLVGMDWIQLLPMYYSSTAVLLIGNIENVIMVNQNGERFVKEDGRRDEVSAAELAQDKQGMFMLYTPALMSHYPQAPLDGLKDNPYFFKAESIAELAEKMGASVESLEKSIVEYNDGKKNGNDKFGRSIYGAEFDENADVFYATWTHPFIHHTMGGIKINPEAQVIDTNGNIIPGLYAAGEVTGGVHGTNRLGGNAITDIIVYGRIAGQNAAAE